MNATRENIRLRLVGAWRLVRWEVRDQNGSLSFPLGHDAVGQIQYSEDGRVSAQLMRPHQAHFASDDWRQATENEKGQAWSNYFGYFGTYTIDETTNVVSHHVEGSWFPNLVSQIENRHYTFEEGRLLLDADTHWGKVHIVWERERPTEP
jgi:hypothetical protein